MICGKKPFKKPIASRFFKAFSYIGLFSVALSAYAQNIISLNEAINFQIESYSSYNVLRSAL